MGEEVASEAPFLFFTDHNEELAKAVREGRRREFSSFSHFSDPKLLAKLPDPNAPETFERSKPVAQPQTAAARTRLYTELLKIRSTEIIPRLSGAQALDAIVLGPAAVMAQWRMGDVSRLVIATNLGSSTVEMPAQPGPFLFTAGEHSREQAVAGRLTAYSTIAALYTT